MSAIPFQWVQIIIFMDCYNILQLIIMFYIFANIFVCVCSDSFMLEKSNA